MNHKSIGARSSHLGSNDVRSVTSRNSKKSDNKEIVHLSHAGSQLSRRASTLEVENVFQETENELDVEGTEELKNE